MEPYHRLFRAVGFGGAAAFGFNFAGFTTGACLAIGFVIATLFILNIWTYLGASVAAAAIIWGGLSAARLAPGFASVAAFEKSAMTSVQQTNQQTKTKIALQSPGENESAASASTKTLAQQLADLKQACNAGLMSKEECSAARTRILSHL